MPMFWRRAALCAAGLLALVTMAGCSANGGRFPFCWNRGDHCPPGPKMVSDGEFGHVGAMTPYRSVNEYDWSPSEIADPHSLQPLYAPPSDDGTNGIQTNPSVVPPLPESGALPRLPDGFRDAHRPNDSTGPAFAGNRPTQMQNKLVPIPQRSPRMIRRMGTGVRRFFGRLRGRRLIGRRTDDSLLIGVAAASSIDGGMTDEAESRRVLAPRVSDVPTLASHQVDSPEVPAGSDEYDTWGAAIPWADRQSKSSCRRVKTHGDDSSSTPESSQSQESESTPQIEPWPFHRASPGQSVPPIRSTQRAKFEAPSITPSATDVSDVGEVSRVFVTPALKLR